MRKLIGGILFIAVAGGGAYYIYKQSKQSNVTDAEDDYIAGMDTSAGTFPVLPIHPRSDPTVTQGVYASITSSYGKKSITARNTDYINPSQLVPTSGPGNLAPIAGNTRELDFAGVNIRQQSGVIAGGPCPANAGTQGMFGEDRQEVKGF